MKRKQIVFILSYTFISVVAWIGFNIYHISVTSTIPEDVALQIVPIDPNFDTSVIGLLKQRMQINPLYEISGTPSPSASSSADLSSGSSSSELPEQSTQTP